jgi:hypothetical protein
MRANKMCARLLTVPDEITIINIKLEVNMSKKAILIILMIIITFIIITCDKNETKPIIKKDETTKLKDDKNKQNKQFKIYLMAVNEIENDKINTNDDFNNIKKQKIDNNGDYLYVAIFKNYLIFYKSYEDWIYGFEVYKTNNSLSIIDHLKKEKPIYISDINEIGKKTKQIWEIAEFKGIYNELIVITFCVPYGGYGDFEYMEVYDLSNNLLLFSGLHYKKSFKIQNNNFIIYTKVSEEQISGPKAPEPGQIKVKYTFRKNILDINNNVINQADDEIEVISGHIRN